MRLEAPPREGCFFRADLYGKFQKSTAGTQNGNPARTRIPHFATSEGCLRRVCGRLLQAGGGSLGRREGEGECLLQGRSVLVTYPTGGLPYRAPANLGLRAPTAPRAAPNARPRVARRLLPR